MSALDAKLGPWLVVLAGLLGAAGVALAAMATHMGGDLLGPASAMCLAHAPAMLALYAASSRLRTAIPAGALMGIGAAVFAGDLALKQFYGTSLFPLAAPSGGMMMIGGWLVAGAGGLFSRRH